MVKHRTRGKDGFPSGKAVLGAKGTNGGPKRIGTSLGDTLTYRILSFLSVLVLVSLWYGVTELELVSPLFVPHPMQVWRTFVEVLRNGYRGVPLLSHIWESLVRLGIAYGLSAVIAIPLGLWSGFDTRIRAILDWLVEFYRPLPPLAYYTILVIWLGIDNASKIALLFLAGFAPVYIAAVDGVRNVHPERVQVIQSLGASSWQSFRHVIFPSALPEVFTGLRLSLGFTYTTLVAAEMVAAVSGLGWMVLDASKFLRSDVIFMGIIIMGFTAVGLDRCLRFLEHKCVPWRGKG